MKNQAQLIAYVDRLTGGTFHDLERLLAGPLRGAFGGVHVLPFFHPIDGADAGFDPIDHTVVDPRLGTWDDVRALARQTEVMADVIVNHVSSRSPQFEDYLRCGASSRSAGMFLTYSHVFPHGAREADLLALHRLRPDLPFTTYRTAQEEVVLWTTFTREQIDIDVDHAEGRRYLDSVLTHVHQAGIRAIRLDAVGFAVKKAGTSCFMIPETFAFISAFIARAHALDIEVLVETHAHYLEQIRIARQVDWVYDFALPPLVLHTLYRRDATQLTRWLDVRPRNAITVLDTHDGIGIRDAVDLLLPEELEALADTIHERSRHESREATGGAAHNVDVHQINCTFYDALGCRDEEYLIARALQCFIPGIPQVYYVGLLVGRNDMALLRRTGVGRDINRRYYAAGEVEQQLRRPVVQTLVSLLTLRNTHPAFGGAFAVASTAPDCLAMQWRNGGAWARLDVRLMGMSASVTCSRADNDPRGEVAWSSGR